MNLNDPIGEAILAYSEDKKPSEIIVKSDLCEDDIIETSYLFRTFNQMPALERKALSLAKGSVLDVGACAGCHSKYLKEKDFTVLSLDSSPGAIKHLSRKGLDAVHSEILEFNQGKYDTILLLMNGLGLAQTLEELPHFLRHLKSLLKPGGSIICDSSDIKYMYEDDEGAIWMDLNSSYYGEMKFNMQYSKSETGWFNWLYVDQITLQEVCKTLGMDCQIVFEGENHHFLAQLK